MKQGLGIAFAMAVSAVSLGYGGGSPSPELKESRTATKAALDRDNPRAVDLHLEIGSDDQILVNVDIDGVPRQLVLQPYSVRGSSFSVLVDENGAFRGVPAPAEHTYRGEVDAICEIRPRRFIVALLVSAFIFTPSS